MTGQYRGQKIYDLVWSSETLAKFQNQYPEAFKEVCRVCNITRNDVVRYVSADQEKWRQFKKLVKYRHKFEAAHRQLSLMAEDLTKTT